MTKPYKSSEVLDQAMQEALASVERISQTRRSEQDGAAVDIDVTEATKVEANTDSSEKATRLQGENEVLREQLLRMAADFDNFRKRTRKEQEETRRFGIDRVLVDVLPILDNLDRALSHSALNDDPVITGVRMVAKQFHDILASHGVTPFVSLGQPFDPERHEAVNQQITYDQPAGTVLTEMQRGYLLHERLLRPARVTVAVAPQEPVPTA